MTQGITEAIDLLVRAIEGTKLAQVNLENSEVEPAYLSLAIRVGGYDGNGFYADIKTEPMWTKEVLKEVHIAARSSESTFSVRTLKEFVLVGDIKYQWIILAQFAPENAVSSILALADCFRVENFIQPTAVSEIPMLGAPPGRNQPSELGGGAVPSFDKQTFNPKRSRG